MKTLITCFVAVLMMLCYKYAAAKIAMPPDLLSSTNPTTCSGSEGTITFNGLTPNASYQITYIDNGTLRGPVTMVANATGHVTITGLSKGLYTNFIFDLNGTITEVFTGVVLSDPIFVPSFNSFPPFCEGTTPPILPAVSNNGINGTWSPAVVSNTATGTYTFTPAANICALPVTITITVTPRVTPVFAFGTSLVICESGTVPVLPNTSLNGISGTWSPSVVDPANSGVYVFTPSSPGCVRGTSFTVTINPNITPTFSFGSSGAVCTGQPVSGLPTTSTNGITGTWSPAVVDNQSSGIYTFTPGPGQCASPVSYTQTVNPIIPPVFNFGTSLTICSGDAVPGLPTTSDNGITGTWDPAVVSNTASGTYTFTSSSDPCAPPVTFNVTVNPVVTPSFSFGTAQSVCINATAPVLPAVSTNGITGAWSPAVVDNQLSGTYTFTPNPGQCARNVTFNYEVNPIPAITNSKVDTTVYDGDMLPPYNFAFNNAGSGVTWTNNNPSIGLAATGTGNIPTFRAVNNTNAPVMGTVTATPFINGCIGASQMYRIIVLPLVKDIFVPNVFSPNGDGKNDLLQVYGNYINTVEMHIFNQWGERIATLNGKNHGWDGRHRGTPQPVGVYVYVLKAMMMDGKQVNMKGTVTLVR